MSLHLNLSTGKFLNSSTLFKLSDALLLDVSSGEIVMSNLLVPRAGVDLFKLASLDLNFAQRKSLTDRVSGNNLVTFSRSSGTGYGATYVDSDGLIKTSPVNLKPYSEEADTFSFSEVTVTANQFAAPDGTFTADRVDITSANGLHYLHVGHLVAGVISSTTSVYVKAISNVTQVQLNANISGGRASAVFDLVNVTTDSAVAGNVIFADSSIASVGNGWYRISFVQTTNGSNASSVKLSFTEGNADPFDDRNGQTFVGTNESVAVWGAQVEKGVTTPSDYIPTQGTASGAPRFDHDPVTGESLGLLIEEERTNKMPRSENFVSSSNYWRTQDGSNTSISNITSPDGVSKMWLIDLSSQSGTSASGSRVYQTGIALSNSGGNTFSFYARSVSGTGTFPVGYFDGSNYIKSYVTLTEETQRHNISIPSSPGVNIVGFTRRGVTHDETLTQAYVWGAQVEEGSFPTSIIPTNGSTVTRSPDIVSIEGNKFAKTNLLEYSERFDQSVWTKQTSVTIKPNSIAAPDGTTTGTLYSISATTQRAIDQSISGLANGDSFVFSIYIKAIVDTNLKIRTLTDNSTLFDKQILAADGWQKIQVPFTKNSSQTSIGFFDNSGNTGNRFYIWGAQLEEGDELTEYTPSVDTFDSRASSATYVDDATGLIKTTPVNLIKYSQDFTNSFWRNALSSSTVTSPDGGQNTYEVKSYNLLFQDTEASVLANTTNTTSIFAKYAGVGNSAGIQVRVAGVGTNAPWANFSLANGSVGNTSAASDTSADGDSWTLIDYGIEPFANGWYRIHITYTCSKATRISFRPSGSPATDGENSVGSGKVLVFGAQAEEGTTATPYIKTTSTVSGAARYEGGELLLEPARTNKMRLSEDLTESALWQGQNGATSSLSNITSPDGVSNMWLVDLSAQAGTSTVGPRLYQGSLAFNNVANTFSFYARSVSGTGTFPVGYYDGFNYIKSYVTLTEKTQRYEISCPTGLSSSVYNIFGFTRRGLTHDETLTQAYVWGCQVEAAPYASSYIPTDGTAGGITRAADVSTSTLGLDSWYNQAEGAVFVDFMSLPGNNIRNEVVSINDGSLSNRISISNKDSNSYQTQIYKENSLKLRGDYPFDSERKVSLAYKTNDANYSYSGQIGVLDTSVTLPVVDKVDIGYLNDYLNGHISRLAYFPTRKTDQELIKLTDS